MRRRTADFLQGKNPSMRPDGVLANVCSKSFEEPGQRMRRKRERQQVDEHSRLRGLEKMFWDRGGKGSGELRRMRPMPRSCIHSTMNDTKIKHHILNSVKKCRHVPQPVHIADKVNASQYWF
jgi:hypothetical protein